MSVYVYVPTELTNKSTFLVVSMSLGAELFHEKSNPVKKN